MRQIQRVLLMAAVVVMIGVGIVLPQLESAKKLQSQWELLQAERFMERICRNKECSYEEYVLLHGVLNYTGISSVIWVEEYQKEQDMAGNTYYYGISWGEIQEILFLEGRYCFHEDSVIVLGVNRNSGSGNQKNKYYDIVSGKD